MSTYSNKPMSQPMSKPSRAHARTRLTQRFKEMVRPALGLGILVTLASLTLVAGRADASGNISVQGSITIGDPPRGPVHQIVPVPNSGVRVDLWADPGAGAYVRPGDAVRFFFQTNADCYVTLVSVDTEGRARLLFPTYGEDGWVHAGRTYRLPGRRSDYDFRFNGPAGIEYVFAVASLSPPYPYYPAWMVEDQCWDLGHWRRDYEPTLYETGWVVGDPLWSIRDFVFELVGRHSNPRSYDSEWISFYVGYRKPGHGHWGYCDHNHCTCGGVRIYLGGIVVSTGRFDFHVHTRPHYHYKVCRGWAKPKFYKGWYEPHGRWKWSDHAHATPSKPRPNWTLPGPNGSPRGKDRGVVSGPRDGRNGWGRGDHRDDRDRRNRSDRDDRRDHRDQVDRDDRYERSHRPDRTRDREGREREAPKRRLSDIFSSNDQGDDGGRGDRGRIEPKRDDRNNRKEKVTDRSRSDRSRERGSADSGRKSVETKSKRKSKTDRNERDRSQDKESSRRSRGR